MEKQEVIELSYRHAYQILIQLMKASKQEKPDWDDILNNIKNLTYYLEDYTEQTQEETPEQEDPQNAQNDQNGETASWQ